MGKGKTDMALAIGELLLNAGAVIEVGTNIRVNGAPGFRHITNVMELKKWLKEVKGPKLFILDEAGIHLDARNPLSKLNREIRHIAMLLRKHRAKLILVSQRAKDIESAFRDTDIWLATIKKISKKRAEVITNPGNMVFEITGIRRTCIKYDTYDVAPFFLEPELVANPDGPMPPEEKVAYLYAQGKSLREIGRELGVRHQTAMEMLRRFLRQIFSVRGTSGQSGEEDKGPSEEPPGEQVNGENGPSEMGFYNSRHIVNCGCSKIQDSGEEHARERDSSD